MGATMTMPAPPTEPGVEMTLAQFLDSKWARRMARGVWITLGIFVPLGAAILGYMVYDSRAQATSASEMATDVKIAVDRLAPTISEIKTTVGDLTDTLADVQIDAARTRGVVEQMQRQQSREAVWARPPGVMLGQSEP